MRRKSSSQTPVGSPDVTQEILEGRSVGRQRSSQHRRFPEYLDREELQRGLKSGQVLSGRLRINANERSEAYVTIEGLSKDVFIKGPAQNRAIDGDLVALRLDNISDWREIRSNGQNSGPSQLLPRRQAPPPAQVSPLEAMFKPAAHAADQKTQAVSPLAFLGMIKQGYQAPSIPIPPQPQVDPDRPWEGCSSSEKAVEAIAQELTERPACRPTGRVVAIMEPSAKREMVVGVLLPQEGTGYLQLMPADPRLPPMVVPVAELDELPESVRQEASDANAKQRSLVSARVVEWRVECNKPRAAVRQHIGQAGDIESETAALLMFEQVPTGEFSEEVLACLPQGPWAISQQELDGRRDFRSTRIFSIDPPTARDLDDALSIELLPGGSFRVGVHIADVAHFIPPGSPLDREAALRATSVYLVDRVIPMLPRMLCENLCSLNPGVERLAFSVTWDMSPEGEIQAMWAGRSVIRSCAKLAYHHAQQMIDTEFDEAECPVELHGGYSWEEVKQDVLALYGIAGSLRAGRFASGALKLDNVKLVFQLDEYGNPREACPYRQTQAHWLVEELMLLANRTVAKITADTFPELAVLRNHPPPDPRKLEELTALSEAVGVQLDTGSAAALQASLERLRSSCQEPALAAAVQNLATKPMQLAKYFCTGSVADPMQWRHYALAVDHYTHFTSPIRRYPDIMVHRLLAAALEIGPPTVEGGPRAHPPDALRVAATHALVPEKDSNVVLTHANARRVAARNVQDGSSRLFLAVLLRQKPIIAQAVMLAPGGDRYVGVYLPDFGCECKIEYAQCTTPVTAQFDKEAATVRLLPASEDGPAQQQPRRRLNQGGSGSGSGRNQDFDEGAWAESMQRLQNPAGLLPLQLPAELRAFTLVPVVVGSFVTTSIAGRPVDIAARLYVGERLPTADAGASRSVQEDAAPAAVGGYLMAEERSLE